ncbi:MAG: cell division protein ZapA [Vicinamibacteria bacterium]
MADKPALVHVEIFGQTYALKAGSEPGYVERLAAHVDKEMREISRMGGAVDSVRIAVLAALNIADEAFRLQNEADKVQALANAKASKLASDLDRALVE